MEVFKTIGDLASFIANFLVSSFDFILKGLYFVFSMITYLPFTIIDIVLHLPSPISGLLISFLSFIIGMLALKVIALVLSAMDIL